MENRRNTDRAVSATVSAVTPPPPSRKPALDTQALGETAGEKNECSQGNRKREGYVRQ